MLLIVMGYNYPLLWRPAS